MNKQKNLFLKKLKENSISQTAIDAFAAVEQEHFIQKSVGMSHYQMKPIPIGFGEKSDDPLLLAEMIDILSPRNDWRLLEVGGGSGYSTAILSTMVREVVSVEFNEPLATMAKEHLIDKGFFNVRSFAGDATNIGADLGMFDGIIIFAACIQRPMHLLAMLKNSHYAVFPMGPPVRQQIVKYRNTAIGEHDTLKNFSFYRFCDVESIRGRYGWVDQPPMAPEMPEKIISETGE
jgi:protein-L-isoaspartate(D-aspartate) O-methyltransferase